VRQELEYVRRNDVDRGLGDDREERLEIERCGAQRLRSATASNEGQIAIDQGLAQREPGLTSW